MYFHDPWLYLTRWKEDLHISLFQTKNFALFIYLRIFHSNKFSVFFFRGIRKKIIIIMNENRHVACNRHYSTVYLSIHSLVYSTTIYLYLYAFIYLLCFFFSSTFDRKSYFFFLHYFSLILVCSTKILSCIEAKMKKKKKP